MLPDDGAAVIYANRIIGELKEAGGYDDPGLVMIIRKEGSESEIRCRFLQIEEQLKCCRLKSCRLK